MRIRHTTQTLPRTAHPPRATLLLAAALLIASPPRAGAQTTRDEIADNIRLSAGTAAAYLPPLPDDIRAPEGKRAFYISHYGRHGSRFLVGRDEYEEAYSVLAAADRASALSAIGKDVMRRTDRLRAEASGRYGELTPLGWRQVSDIAERMCGRFPDVFAPGAVIDAHSATVLRCVLSMTAAMTRIVALHPGVAAACTASAAETDYMSYTDKSPRTEAANRDARQSPDDYRNATSHTAKTIAALFTDSLYVAAHVNVPKLYDRLLTLAHSVQSSSLRTQLTLYDLFDDDELYDAWQKANAARYMSCAAAARSADRQPTSPQRLLKRIIADADSAIARDTPGATLRFGHDNALLPLLCLMDINGAGLTAERPEDIDTKGWADYRLSPMAANVQLVFFRENPTDTDIVVLALLNETAATLPLPTDIAPYYHWADVRAYLSALAGKDE